MKLSDIRNQNLIFVDSTEVLNKKKILYTKIQLFSFLLEMKNQKKKFSIL